MLLAPAKRNGEYPPSVRQRSLSTETGVIVPRFVSLKPAATNWSSIELPRTPAANFSRDSSVGICCGGRGDLTAMGSMGRMNREPPLGDRRIITDDHVRLAYSRVLESYTRKENVSSSARSKMSDRPKFTRSIGSASRFTASLGTPADTKASETTSNVAASPVDTNTIGSSKDG